VVASRLELLQDARADLSRVILSADMQFFVRTAGNRALPMSAISESARAIDRSLRISVNRLDDNLALWIWPSQMGALLSGGLGFLRCCWRRREYMR
jgi:hypothetical protein